MSRSALIAALLAALIPLAPASARAADFPIYPGVRRMVAPGMDQNMPSAVLVSRDAPRRIFDWYVARLKAAGWQLQSQEFDASAKSFAIVAMQGSGENQQIATLGGGPRDGATGSQLTAVLIGSSVPTDVFKGIPTEEIKTDPEPDKQIDDEPIPGLPTPAQIAKMERTMPKTAPNALQKAIVDYPATLEKFLKATLTWADSPTRANLMSALGAVPAYVRAADGLRAASSAGMRARAGASFSGFLWSKQIMTDIIVGMIISGLETVRDTPSAAAAMRGQLRAQVAKLLDEDVKAFRAGVKEGDRLSERIKQGGPGPDELDTVLTNDQIKATPETIYIPRTDLRVRSMWTPLPSYWRQVLKESATALRCWNAGCPDGCTTDDEGTIHCKAFGPCPNREDPKPSDPHCLNLLRTHEREVELLSHPMTLYCLLSLAIEVGDPAQLDAGGKITVTVDGEKLTEIPLEAIRRPFHGNLNPYDRSGSAPVPQLPARLDILEQIAQATGLLFGQDAEKEYRATSRMPWVVSESAGGEFHGYTLFLQVGAPVGGSSVMANPAAYGSANFAEYWQRLLRIAEKTHPAIEKEHKIVLRAEVGGMISDGVEIKLPAAFRSLSDSVGRFGGWPGTEPDKWEFDRELGPTPPKAVPDHTTLDIGASAEDIQTNTRKLAMVYTWLIFQDWVKALAMAGVDCALSKLSSLMSSKEVAQAEAAVSSSTGYKAVTKKALNAFADTMTDVSGAPDYLSHWAGASLLDKLKDLGYEKLTEKFGRDFIELAKKEKKDGVITLDLTKTGLRYSVQRQIAYHRRMIRHIGDTQLMFKGKVDDLLAKVKFARNLVSTTLAKPYKYLLAPILAGEKGAAASLLVSDICAVKEIWYQVHLIDKYLQQDNSWMK